jgi:hydroxymethylglutaryl-CoA lyase
MVLPSRVRITEVCPRDGFQSLSKEISTKTKIDIINRLNKCGFPQIEVVSLVHPKAVPQMKDADKVLKEINRDSTVEYRALIPNLRGLERAIKGKVDKAKLMLSATDSHSLHNANMTTLESMEQFTTIAKYADNKEIKLSGSISVAFGCPYEGDVPIKRLIAICKKYEEIGIREISLADTTGMANPLLIRKVISSLRERAPETHFSLHLHNTRGLAFANAVAGLEEGITDFDSSTSGLGGCPYAPNASGNIATEDLVHGFEEMGVSTGVDLDSVIEVSRILANEFPEESDSFILKAGKSKDLYNAPGKQVKLGDL